MIKTVIKKKNTSNFDLGRADNRKLIFFMDDFDFILFFYQFFCNETIPSSSTTQCMMIGMTSLAGSYCHWNSNINVLY